MKFMSNEYVEWHPPECWPEVGSIIAPFCFTTARQMLPSCIFVKLFDLCGVTHPPVIRFKKQVFVRTIYGQVSRKEEWRRPIRVDDLGRFPEWAAVMRPRLYVRTPQPGVMQTDRDWVVAWYQDLCWKTDGMAPIIIILMCISSSD
jgi:hypothetical protein